MSNFLARAADLISVSQQNAHRALICLSGQQHWAEERATALLEHLDMQALWVSDMPAQPREFVDFNSSRRWLGRELDALVFDAHTGFDPNIFALLTGTLLAGAPLILLTPPLTQWPEHPDPVNKRCSVWGADVRVSRYLARLAAQLPQLSQLLLAQDNEQISQALRPVTQSSTALDEQVQLLQSIVSNFKLDTKWLAVISGDRGRGKSAALGQLAARLVSAGAKRILVTAPRKAAVDVLMQHATQHWPSEAPALTECLTFLPPDQLCLNPEPCDALLIDEMGGIHLGLLQRLLEHYPRLAMAGTVHGYEGAGRGFHTRLRRHIEQQFPHCQWQQLQQPVRWANNDPLEQSSQQLLMLDAEYIHTTGDDLSFDFLDRDQLAQDDALLRQVHGLLAAAHYRTRPLDLRQMLDGPNIKIATLRHQKVVVAACLMAVEGPLTDTDLNAQIVAAKRRPAGHLLPQILMQRLQLPQAANLRYWRIVRIAVQPERQNEGIGKRFLAQLQEQAKADEVDCLGSVFAVEQAVLKFWQAAGFTGIHLGDNCEATSGSYALSILKPLTAQAKALTVDAKTTWNNTRKGALHKSHPALSQQLCCDLEDEFLAVENPINGIIGA